VNNFNLVLSAIKEHCKEVNVPRQVCFEKLKAELEKRGQDHLDFYLDFLQDLGLIRHQGDDMIILTERGNVTDQLFN